MPPPELRTSLPRYAAQTPEPEAVELDRHAQLGIPGRPDLVLGPSNTALGVLTLTAVGTGKEAYSPAVRNLLYETFLL